MSGFPQPVTAASSLGIGATTPSVTGAIATAPTLGSTAQAVTLGTPVQNTVSYDRLLQVTVVILSATTATITAGVSSSSSPGVQTMIPSFSLAVTGFVNFVLYVPAGYYAVIGTTGTISATGAGQWQPV